VVQSARSASEQRKYLCSARAEKEGYYMDLIAVLKFFAVGILGVAFIVVCIFIEWFAED
jgi:hypothetical protein